MPREISCNNTVFVKHTVICKRCREGTWNFGDEKRTKNIGRIMMKRREFGIRLANKLKDKLKKKKEKKCACLMRRGRHKILRSFVWLVSYTLCKGGKNFWQYIPSRRVELFFLHRYQARKNHAKKLFFYAW